MLTSKFTTLLCRLLMLIGILMNAFVLVGQVQTAPSSDAPVMADAGEDDEDYEPIIKTASILARYDNGGKAELNVFLSEDTADLTALITAIERGFHCAPGTLAHPAPRRYPDSVRLAPEQRAKLEKQGELVRLRTLDGTCAGAMTRDKFLFTTDIDVQPILTELARIGEQQLLVNLTFPESKFSETSAAYKQPTRRPGAYESYTFPIAAPNVPVVHLAYGQRSRDLVRSLALSFGVLLLPIVIVLWMRRAAQRDAADDPTAAWFSYFRVLQWCTVGVLLLWMVGGSFRRGLQDATSLISAGHDVTAVAIRVSILMLPPWIVYLVCLLFSYRIYVNVRGESWTRGEFYANQVLQIAAQLLPLMCINAGIEMLFVNRRVAMALFVAVYFTFMICTRLRLKVSGTHPEALTTGELRDCVFDLARRAGIEVQQIYVVPAGKSLMANAFAAKNKVVMFTDYLLARLNKREVTAVAAHEVTHVQRKHITWKALALIGLILSPMLMRAGLEILRGILGLLAEFRVPGFLRAEMILDSISRFSELDLIVFGIAFALFHLQSRYMEHKADEGAVRLTGDPEAVITGLLKLSRLNLMPIQWGRVSGALMTHPTMLKRVQRIASVGNVPQARLDELLAQFREPQAGVDLRAPMPAPAPADVFTEAKPAEQRVVSTAKTTQSTLDKLWVLLFFHIAPACVVAWTVQRWNLKPWWAAYLLGAVACIVIYAIVMRWLGLWGRKRLLRAFTSKLQKEAIGAEGVLLVGLSPHSTPRYYVSSYEWDNGCLVLRSDRLYYIGDHLRFALRPPQLMNVRLGRGVPSWFPVQRVYIDWRDDAGVMQTWNLSPMMPSSPWRVAQQSKELRSALRSWMADSRKCPNSEQSLGQLQSPSLGEVTSKSIKKLTTFGRFMNHAFWIVLLAMAAATALHVPSRWYVFCVVLLLRLYEVLPYWAYKEEAPKAQSMAASASVGR